MSEPNPNGCAECGHGNHAGPCTEPDPSGLPCGCAHRFPRARDDSARFYNFPGEDLPDEDD